LRFIAGDGAKQAGAHDAELPAQVRERSADALQGVGAFHVRNIG